MDWQANSFRLKVKKKIGDDTYTDKHTTYIPHSTHLHSYKHSYISAYRYRGRGGSETKA